MACLRRVSGRISLSPRRLCQFLGPILHDNKQDTKSDSPDSSRMIRRFLSYGLHSRVQRLGCLLEERNQTSFARQVGSPFWASRYMSTISEELCSKADGFGTVVEELVPEKTVEAVATQVSAMEEVAEAVADSSSFLICEQYLIGGVHASTGLNWWLSIALTAVLVNGVTLPFYIRYLKSAWDLNEFSPLVQKLKKLKTKIEAGDQRALAAYKKEEAALKKERCSALGNSVLEVMIFDGFIYVGFIVAIRNMAQKIPSFKSGGILWFTNLSTPDNLFILPLATGLTFWFAGEVFQRQKNLVDGTRRLLWCIFASVALQATFEFESAVFCFMIPSRLCTIAVVQLALRSPKMQKLLKLRRVLGFPPAAAPLPGSSSHSASENKTPVAESLSEPSKITQRILSLRKQLSDMPKKDRK